MEVTHKFDGRSKGSFSLDQFRDLLRNKLSEATTSYATIEVNGATRRELRFHELRDWSRALDEPFSSATLYADVGKLRIRFTLDARQAALECQAGLETPDAELAKAETLFRDICTELGLVADAAKDRGDGETGLSPRFRFELDSDCALEPTRLRAFIERYLQGARSGARGTLEFAGQPTRIVSFQDVLTWAAALETNVLNGWLNCSLDGADLSLWIDQRAGLRCRFSLQTSEPSSVRVKELVESAQRELKLSLRDKQSTAPRASVEGRFALPRDGAAAVQGLLTSARQLVGGDECAFSYVLSAESHLELRIESLSQAEQILVTRWDDLTSWQFELRSPTRRLTMRQHARSLEFSVEVDAEGSLAREFVDKQVPSLGFAPARSGEADPRERRFLIRAKVLSPEWVARLLTTLRSKVGQHVYDSATLTAALTGDANAATNQGTRSFQNLDNWVTTVKQEWPQLVKLSAWISGRQGRLHAQVDLTRELLSLEAVTISSDEAESWLQDLATKLQLDPEPPELYRYRKFKNTYNFAGWPGPEQFAEHLQAAIAWCFQRPDAPQQEKPGTGKPVRDPRLILTRGFVTYGTAGTERLEGVVSLDEFFTKLSSAGKMAAAALAVDSRRGDYIAIDVDVETKELVLRGSLDHSRFKQLADYLEENLLLRLKKAEAGEKKESSKSGSVLLGGLVGGLGAALVGVLSSSIATFREPPKLTIMTPPVPSSGPFVATKQPLPLTWCLTRQRIAGPGTDCTARATVKVRPEGPGKAIEVTADGSYELKGLPAGAYHVTVQAADYPPASISVQLPAP